MTHVWSLAVEEQFYLVWPLVVLFLPRRIMPWAIGGMIAVAIVTRTTLTLTTDMWEDGIGILTPSVLDALGLGALLAFLWRTTLDTDRIVGWLGVVGIAVLTARWALADADGVAAVTEIGWSLVFVWLVHRTSRGVDGPLGRILRWRWLAHIGVVSYGIYLFHLFVVPVGEIVERRLGVDLPIPDLGFDRFVVMTVVSVAVATASWIVIERPINDQKRRFPYVRAVDPTQIGRDRSSLVAPPTEATDGSPGRLQPMRSPSRLDSGRLSGDRRDRRGRGTSGEQ